jgi:two-component system sensor histidine kinase AdeS
LDIALVKHESQGTRRHWSLATQLGLTLAVCVVLFAAIVIGVMEVWGYYEAARIEARMPLELRVISATLDAGRTPSPAALTKLLAFYDQTQDESFLRSSLALAGSTLFAATIVFSTGLLVFRRIGAGLDDVAAMAVRLSGGDLTVRSHETAWASREEAALTESFNRMAETLQRAERELQENAAAIAHELRTPLTVLTGRLRGIADGIFELGPDQIAALLYQTDALTRLVEDLRTLSLANASQLVLQRAPTDLAAEVRHVLHGVQGELAAAGLEVKLALRSAPVLADGARVRQLLGAVLENVRRYAAAGGEVTIETAIVETRAMIRVLDRGPGLAAGATERAFQYFWRADPSRARYSGGSGLGLPVVSAIARAHGGSATLQPRPGGGLIFTLDLPA